MKKVWKCLLVACLLFSLTGCSKASTNSHVAAQGEIAPYLLTESGQRVLDAFGMRDTAQIISFQAPEDACSMQVHVYRLGQDGTWESIGGGGLSMDTEEALDTPLAGTFAMQLGENYGIDIFIQCAGFYTFQTDAITLEQKMISSTKGFFQDAQEIVLDTEIPVAFMVYDSGTKMPSYTLQDYFEPARFEGMDLVQMVTLEFSD